MSRRDRPESGTPAPESSPPAVSAAVDPTPPDTSVGFKHGSRDAEVLHAALSRVCRLLGYADPHMPAHVGDIDSSGVSPELEGLVAFARGARLP